MKKISISFILMMIFIISCDKSEKIEEADNTPPEIVTELSATPMNSAVKISWINPGDEDFSKTIITYGTTQIEMGNSSNEKIIEDLTNGTEYTFYISTIDDSENSSEPVIIKATPDKYVTKVEGKTILSGNYEVINASFPISILINNDQYKRVMEAGGTLYTWEGSWSIENDTSYLFDYEYYTIDFRGTLHVADLEVRRNIALCYDFLDSTIYIEYAYTKTEGNDSFLPGKYRLNNKTISSDESSYSDTTYSYVTILDDGTVNFSESNNDTSSSTWENSDLLNGQYLFVTYNSKTYLIIRDRYYRFFKN